MSTDTDRAALERALVDEKKLASCEALKARIKEHRRQGQLAQNRIDACRQLLARVPSELAVLGGVIETWHRIRKYHNAVATMSETHMRDLGQEPPGMMD